MPEPAIVRGLRVSELGAGDPDRFARLLAQADDSVVNTLVFDTKTEAGTVLYDTDVDFAHEIGAVIDTYDPQELIQQARVHGLYTITRIVAFEDDRWAEARPDKTLSGTWLNVADRASWDYPIDLAVEACRLGFDEIQFDYIRFPDGLAAQRAAALVPGAQDERTAAVADFLTEVRRRLDSDGCRLSATVFGIVTASVTDEGIGQTIETVSATVDAISPMLYPSHYGPGWIGLSDPNDHPGPVIAHALDSAQPQLNDGTTMRPWIQGFYYNGGQIQAEIAEAERRGAGWMIWNASGTYSDSWLPPAE